MRTILRYTKKTRKAFSFEAVIGRHRLFTVEVPGTLWKLDNRQDMADQFFVSCLTSQQQLVYLRDGSAQAILRAATPR